MKDKSSIREEALREAADKVGEAGNIANMLWNDNVDKDENLVRREFAFKLRAAILALIDAPQGGDTAAARVVDEIDAALHQENKDGK